MGQYSRQEIEDAFRHFQEAADRSSKSGEWREWSECFTEDCTYKEHLYGEMGGREAIRTWINRVMVETYPGNEMPHFPIDWYVIDEERGWVLCSVWNEMDDPGDGSLHREYNWTMLHYAGDGRFSYEEDLYNPVEFGRMVERWHEVKDRLAGSAQN